jgi:DNA-binding NarL/FixJ family response regulator
MMTAPSIAPIRIVLTDDHLDERVGLKARLAGASDLQVVGEAANGRDALALITRLAPEVAVLDFDMPLVNGIALLRTLAASGSRTRVLIVTMHDDIDLLGPLLKAGASGYLVNSVADVEFAQAIRTVAAAGMYVSPTAPLAFAPIARERSRRRAARIHFDTLSARERDVLVLVAEGYSASEIGQRLLVSRKSVETYKQRISEKLALHHRTAYVQFCLRLDLLHAHS